MEESGGRGKGSCGSDKQQKKKGRGKVSEGKGREKRVEGSKVFELSRNRWRNHSVLIGFVFVKADHSDVTIQERWRVIK